MSGLTDLAPSFNRAAFNQDAANLLRPEELKRFRPALDAVWNQRQRRFADAAITADQQVQNFTSRAYGFDSLRQQAGIGGTGPAGTPSGASVPWNQFVRSDGSFKLPPGARAGLRQLGLDEPAIAVLERKAAEKLKLTAAQAPTYQQGLSSPYQPTAPDPNAPPDQKLAASKRLLFGKVQSALNAKPDASDAEVGAILRAAFGGPNADQLVKEFGTFQQAQGNSQRDLSGVAGVFQDVQSVYNKAPSALRGPIGQMFRAVQAPGDLVRTLLGVAVGAKAGGRDDDPALRRDLTHEDVQAAVGNLLKGVVNFTTFGTSGTLVPQLKAGGRGATGYATIAETAKVSTPVQLLTGLWTTGAARRSDNRAVRDLGNVLGFVGDIATDPLSYVTFGAGGLGEAATKSVGNAARRLTMLTRLGVDAEAAAPLARASEAAWSKELARLAETHPPEVFKAAEQAAEAAAVRAESVHHADGFKGFSRWLSSEVGVDAEQVFPKAFAFGTKADRAALAARGGVSLRGGVPGLPRASFGVNLAKGTGALHGIRPVSAWWLEPSNAFTRTASKTLDQLAATFNLTGGGDRAFAHEHRGLLNAAAAVSHQADAVRTRGRFFREQITHAEADLRRAFHGDPNAEAKITSLLEEGDASPYAGIRALGKRQHQAIETIRAQIDSARSLAAEHGVTIADLRELSDNQAILERYFPHRIQQEILLGAQRSNGPALVGASKARGLRAGQTLVGPAGTAETLVSGSFREIQDVTSRLFGAEALQGDPFAVAKAYVASVTQAASVNKLTTDLAKRGLIAPAHDDLLARLAPTAGRVGAGDPIRSVWERPFERAEALRNQAVQARDLLGEQASALLGKRADSLERRAQLTETLAQLADRTTQHDAHIDVLTRTVAERQELVDLAREQHGQALTEAKAWHTAAKREQTDAIRLAVRDTRAQRRETARALAQLDKNYTATVKGIESRFAAQMTALAADPAKVRTALLADLERAAQDARDGLRSYAEVKTELSATRDRLAKLEGGDLSAAGSDALYDSAAAAIGAKRARLVALQRTKAAAAGDLNEAIDVAKTEWRYAQNMGKGVNAAYQRLNKLMVERNQLLSDAEALASRAADLTDTVDSAQAAMRVAALREGTDLVNEVGAVVDIGKGLPPALREPLAKLLREHAADLTRAQGRILADSPKLSFLEQAVREFDSPTIGALGLVVRSPNVGEATGAYLAEVARRGDDLLSSWEAAVGGADKAYAEARAEYGRQWTTLLARENDLQERAARAKAMDPLHAAQATAQREGDDLNFFEAELHRDQSQLDAWIDNRDELRATQTLTNLALRETVKTDAALRDALYTTQRTLDTDVATAVESFTELMGDARIFTMMAPQIEHLTAVAGKVPFVNNGYAWPDEIKAVADRVLHLNDDSKRRAFTGVLERFNTFWKRGVLLAPGSAVRRITGNVYNAVVLAGVTPRSFSKAFEAYTMLRGAKTLDQIANPAVRHYMELAFEHNIFEGQTVAQAVSETPLLGGARHPIQAAEQAVFTAAIRGEDIARLAQFIEGLDRGMGPEAARLWTGKYHFFNHELTERERNLIRPLYPFYAYLRNNYALQFSTMFHQPGKTALYGYVMRDFGSRTEAQQEPNWLAQQGGFPIGLHHGSDQELLQNTILDTSPIGAANLIGGLEQSGQGAGFDPQRGDLVNSASPLLQVLGSQVAGTDLMTGRDLGQPGSPASGLWNTPGLRQGFEAIGAIDREGRVSPRWDMTVSKLLPLLARGQRLGGGGSPNQQEGRLEYALSVLGGPNLTRNTPRAQNAATRERIATIQDIMSGAPAGTYPDAQDTRRVARDAAVEEQIRRLLGR